MQVKTITTAAGVNEIDFGNDSSQSTAHFYWLKNLGDSILYVSANPNPVAEKDDVAELPAKGAVSVETDEGKVYILGAGKVEIHRTNSKFCPFDWQSSSSGGGGGGTITVDSELSDTSTNPLQNKVTTAAIKEVNSALETKSDINHIHDITASGNPVIMDNLQGGVPFSEMVVSGKNLLKYPFNETTKTVNGITFTDNGDGTITANGTAVANSVYDLSNFTYKKGIDYILSGCPNGGGNSTYKIKGSKTGLEDDVGNAKLIRVEEDVTSTLCILVYNGCTVENLVFRPQLELGDTATAYTPPITGRGLTVGVSGKNIIAQPFLIEQQGGTLKNNGITYTLNADMSISANGTATADSYCVLQNLASPNINRLKKNTDYFLSGSPVGSGTDTYQIYTGIYDNDGNRLEIYHDYGNGVSIRIANDYRCTTAITIKNRQTVSNLIFRPQLELGSTVTPYEPYHGSTITITPDSNPYTIPDGIRQQNGYNVISASEGEIRVTGVQKNAAIKRIWDDMGMDLLFDGLALVASPAENINLGNYSKYLINCYYDPNAVSKGHCISIVVEYDRLKNIVDKSGVLIHSLYTSYVLELHFSGIMDNANYYVKQNDNEAAAYYTRIYGIK